MASRRIGFAFIGLWAVLSVGALAQFLYESGMVPATEGLILAELRVKLALELMVLNFPAASVATVLPVPVSGPVGEWCVMTLAGFAQWVIFAPILRGVLQRKYNRIRSREKVSPNS